MIMGRKGKHNNSIIRSSRSPPVAADASKLALQHPLPVVLALEPEGPKNPVVKDKAS